VIYLDPFRETSESAVYGPEVYTVGVGPKGPALPRFPVIKKKIIMNIINNQFVI
jgi:hypothetical protein